MANIHDYLHISSSAIAIRASHTTPREFSRCYESVNENEKNSCLRHYLINNRPFLFQDNPILFEQLTQYIADSVGIHANEVKLIGSAKTGFSMGPPPEYGTMFSAKSDLDFVVINEKIFLELEDEFNLWTIQYQSKKLLPQTSKEKIYWPENLITCPKTISRGFIDTNKIPSYAQFFKTQAINQSLFLIKKGLEEINQIIIKKASIRVYKNWKAFARQLKLNTESVLSRL